MTTKMTPIAAEKKLSKNMVKMLMLITFTEGTDREKTPYNELFGYTNFSGYEKHPNIKITSHNYVSTAAGRYQILKKTYDALKMVNFTPEAQDFAAVQLIKDVHAYENVLNGEWEKAIEKCNKIWASLPGSPYGQPTRTVADCLKFLNTL